MCLARHSGPLESDRFDQIANGTLEKDCVSTGSRCGSEAPSLGTESPALVGPGSTDCKMDLCCWKCRFGAHLGVHTGAELVTRASWFDRVCSLFCPIPDAPRYFLLRCASVSSISVTSRAEGTHERSEMPSATRAAVRCAAWRRLLCHG